MAVVKAITSGHCGIASHSTSEQTIQRAPLMGEEDDVGFKISGNAPFYEGLYIYIKISNNNVTYKIYISSLTI